MGLCPGSAQTEAHAGRRAVLPQARGGPGGGRHSLPIAHFRQLHEPLLSRPQLVQPLLIARVAGVALLQAGHLAGELAGSVPQLLDGGVQVLLVFLLQRGRREEQVGTGALVPTWPRQEAVLLSPGRCGRPCCRAPSGPARLPNTQLEGHASTQTDWINVPALPHHCPQWGYSAQLV